MSVPIAKEPSPSTATGAGGSTAAPPARLSSITRVDIPFPPSVGSRGKEGGVKALQRAVTARHTAVSPLAPTRGPRAPLDTHDTCRPANFDGTMITRSSGFAGPVRGALSS
ncbi:hypothetical protein GCM10023215_19410 [Pseudonocardia yuanmonensis]|uniref:Uncharacterized protein n=1 Tax=Pseudonocardia yuanmonensis TaxID=1095914 RepID=A0ABP8W9F6_9PSEU